MIANEAHPDANIIWGTALDNELEDTMKITVIATGFKAEDGKPMASGRTGVASGKTAAEPAKKSPFATQTAAPKKEEAPKQVATDEEAAIISDSDFDDIMAILRKNRG